MGTNNSNDDLRSRLFGSSRLFDLDVLDQWDELNLHSLWSSDERPDDPKAWIVRQVIANHLTPSHREVLTGFWFEGKTIAEMACERWVTRRAVRAMLNRAETNFRKEMKAHYTDYLNVPREER